MITNKRVHKYDIDINNKKSPYLQDQHSHGPLYRTIQISKKFKSMHSNILFIAKVQVYKNTPIVIHVEQDKEAFTSYSKMQVYELL